MEENVMHVPYPVRETGELQSESSVMFQLSFDDMVEEILSDISNKTKAWDTEKREIVWREDPNGEQLINSKGLARIRSILRSKLNRNAPLSDLEEEQIRWIAKEVENLLIDTLFDNWDTYEIKNTTAASTIVQTVGDSVFINLRKAKYGAFLRHLRSTSHTSEVLTSNGGGNGQYTKPQRKGILGRIMG